MAPWYDVRKTAQCHCDLSPKTHGPSVTIKISEKLQLQYSLNYTHLVVLGIVKVFKNKQSLRESHPKGA